jgi:lipoyl(octanoyl) transferase
VHRAGRGGRYTYHGPGQRVGYVLLDLEARGRDVRCYVASLEDWLIATLDRLGVTARKAPGRIGIWVDDASGREAKIGAIGVRVRRWVTFHGFAINLDPDLTHFDAIVPCGIAEYPVTSLAALQRDPSPEKFDAALRQGFSEFLQILDGRVIRP